MGRDGRMRPARRTVVVGLGASALAMWPAAMRAASGAAPDVSPPAELPETKQQPKSAERFEPAPGGAARASSTQR